MISDDFVLKLLLTMVLYLYLVVVFELHDHIKAFLNKLESKRQLKIYKKQIKELQEYNKKHNIKPSNPFNLPTADQAIKNFNWWQKNVLSKSGYKLPK